MFQAEDNAFMQLRNHQAWCNLEFHSRLHDAANQILTGILVCLYAIALAGTRQVMFICSAQGLRQGSATDKEAPPTGKRHTCGRWPSGRSLAAHWKVQKDLQAQPVA